MRRNLAFGKFCLVCIVLIQLSKLAQAQSVKLAWDPPPATDLAGYRVYRSQQPGVYTDPALNGATLLTTAAFTDSTVRKNQTYYYVVTAVSLSGVESSYSNELQTFVSASSRKATQAITATPDQSSGLAVVAYRPEGITISEAVAAAAPLQRSGRIFVEVHDSVNTAISLANLDPTPATVDFYLTDADGATLYTASTMIDGGTRVAAFLNELPFAPAPDVDLSRARTFTFSSSVPLGVTALRGFSNQSSEFLMTFLPVAPLDSGASYRTVIPYYVDGGAGKSRIVMVNPVNTPVSGIVEILTPEGADALHMSYTIPASSAVALPASGAGWIRISPTGFNATPSVQAFLSPESDGAASSDSAFTAVTAITEDSAFLAYFEIRGTAPEPGSVQSGFAVSNSGNSPVTVHVEFLGLDGMLMGSSQTLNVPAMGQITIFSDQMAASLLPVSPFKGFVRISGAPVGVVGFKKSYNEASEVVFTPMPAIPESVLNSETEALFLPTFSDFGFTTDLIFFNPWLL